MPKCKRCQIDTPKQKQYCERCRAIRRREIYDNYNMRRRKSVDLDIALYETAKEGFKRRETLRRRLDAMYDQAYRHTTQAAMMQRRLALKKRLEEVR